MRVLLTGAGGFVAPFLTAELKSSGHEVYLTGFHGGASHRDPFFTADLADRKQALEAIRWAQADAVVHLAGITNVGTQEKDRAPRIVAANVQTTQNVCEALHEQSKPSVFLFISTGLVYRPNSSSHFQGYDEFSDLGPVNDYGWTKLAAEAIVRTYNSSRLKTYVARPFNHTGPGQDQRFVCPSLAMRVVQAKSGDSIPVGNLRAERDFSDVRDIVRAYRLILEKQPEERTFVLGAGRTGPIQDILDFFVEHSGKDLSFEVSQELLRSEHDRVFCQPAMAERVLQWVPEIPFKKTLADVYDFVEKSSQRS